MSEETIEDLIAKHNEGEPAVTEEPEIIVPTPKEEEQENVAGENTATSGRSAFKEHFLNDGFLSGMLLSLFVNSCAFGNAFVYNLIFRNKRHIEWRDLKPEEGSDDEKDINDLIDLYAPKIMAFLDNLPDPVLMFAFVEYGFIVRMSLVSKAIEETTEETEYTEIPEHIYVITRNLHPSYWKEDKEYTDNVAQAYHFESEKQAQDVISMGEFVTKWKTS